MNILRFLRSKLVSACIIFLCLAGWSYLAAFAAVPPAFIALSCGLCLFGAALVWLWQYLRARSRLQKLRRAADELGKKAYLLGEMLECPADAVEEEYFEVMKRVSRAAVSAAEAAIRTRDEYGDYMEKWVHELKTPLTAALQWLGESSVVPLTQMQLFGQLAVISSLVFAVFALYLIAAFFVSWQDIRRNIRGEGRL